MQDVITDRQMEFIANLIADKFEACKTMEEVQKAVEQIRQMANKERKDKQ